MSLRPILWQDVQALSAYLHNLPKASRKYAVQDVLRRAEAADAWRKVFGVAHPEWGDGTLSAACGDPGRVLVPGETMEAESLLLIFQEITSWRAAKNGKCGNVKIS